MRALMITGLLAAFGATAAAPLAAQGRFRGGPAMAGERPGIERILMMRERLELSEDQVRQLDALRLEALARRQEAMTEMMRWQSDLQAGEATRAAAREAMAQRREANREAAEGMRERVEGILTEEQLGALREARGRAGAWARGFRRGRAGAGPRGGAWRDARDRRDRFFPGPGPRGRGFGRRPL